MNEILERINNIKKQKSIIILAHIYEPPEIQDIADFVGDSLDLSYKAMNAVEDIILFCGVHFMAETASILNPKKKVMMPDIQAGCPMADMVDVEYLQNLKNQYPHAKVAAYVNTSAAVKAISDICCTSANAIDIVNSIEADEIIFAPDRNLGDFVQKASGKKMILARGFCPTHNNFILPEFLEKARLEHPNAIALVHPECRPETIALADHAMSTGQMCRFVAQSECKEFIIGTEIGIIHKLKKDNPDKSFYAANMLAVCPNMKKTNLAKVLDVLNKEKNIVEVDPEIAKRAYEPIKKMIDISSAKRAV
jgi:quinolinate synthase